MASNALSGTGRPLQSFFTIAWMLVLLIFPGAASAQDRVRALSHYKHIGFSLEEGAPPAIFAIAQTPDGFLWLGSAKGLFRFDGLTFERVTMPKTMRARSDAVLALKVDRAGNLWIGHDWGGVTMRRNGALRDMNIGRPYGSVVQVVEDENGAIWTFSAGAFQTQICRFRAGKWVWLGGAAGLPKEVIRSALASSDGTIWLAQSHSLSYLRPGHPRFETASFKISSGAALAEGPDHSVWIADVEGVSRLTGGVSGHPLSRGAPIYKTKMAIDSFGLTVDRRGDFWISAGGSGIAHLRTSRTGLVPNVESLRPSDLFAARGLTSPNVLSQFYDREGNFWVGTELGLDQFRRSNFIEALTNLDESKPLLPVLAESMIFRGADGSLVVSVLGKYYRTGRSGALIELPELAKTVSRPCIDPAGKIWMPTARALVKLGSRSKQQIPLPSGTTFPSWSFPCIAGIDQFWIWTNQGLLRYKSGYWKRISLTGKNLRAFPLASTLDRQGTFFGYIGMESLYRVEGDNVIRIWAEDHISIRLINVMYGVGDEILLGAEQGLARYNGHRLQSLRRDTYPFLNAISGIAARAGEIWLTTSQGLVRIDAKELDQAFNHPGRPIHPKAFGVEDGLEGISFPVADNRLAFDRGGMLWIGTNNGIFTINPWNLHQNEVPPSVVIRSVTASGATYPASSRLTLPKGAADVQIDYAAIGLANPARLGVRYKLTGHDTQWVDPGRRRQATYTNLPPGDYHFQVIAANEDGVWNRLGASVDFTIPPTFLQSKWFALLCSGALVLVLALLYNLRMRQVAARAHARFEDRLRERERIARELHDTLLQSVQALIYRFQNIVDDIPIGQAAHGDMLEALDRADEVLAESRLRVRGLRHLDVAPSLEVSVAEKGERLFSRTGTEFRLVVEGSQRILHPAVTVELLAIAEEALINCHRHAEAASVTVQLLFGMQQIQMSIVDDGVGIPCLIADEGGRPDHYGLVGMKERSMKIGATYACRPRPTGGTEVVVSVPAQIAYADRPVPYLLRVRRWLLSALPT